MGVMVVEVLQGATDTPIPTVIQSQSVVSVVAPGGTVANVQYGFDFPSAPYEGQIFIKVTP